MESTQNLKKRIKSVVNINKITKAMELVAATKMRKAQEMALASRPYSFVALDLLANLTLLEKSRHLKIPELLLQRKVKKVLFVLIASDKGLAGSFNDSVFKKFEQHMKRDKEKYKKEEKFFMAIGEKSFHYLSKKLGPMGLDKGNIIKKFVQAGDYTTTEEVQPMAEFIIGGYLENKWDRVIVVSAHFKSALRQEPHVRRILPVDFGHIKETVQELIPTTGKFAELIKENKMDFLGIREENKTPAVEQSRAVKLNSTTQQSLPQGRDYLIEPSPKIVLEGLAKHLLFMQIYHLILEANASEHSARRMAMKTASDNASDLGEELNLQYNKSRQASITSQIIEIVSGAESLN